MKKTLLITSIAMVTSISYAQVTNGLVAKYSFNGGNANDEVGSNHGTINGATLTTDRFGNSNHAYSFDGLDDYIIVPQNTDNDLNLMSNGLSISAWVNPIVIPSSDFASIVTKWCGSTSEQYGIFMNTSGNNVVAIRVVSNVGITDPTVLSAGNWYHVVFTFDKITNEHKFYVDNSNTLTQTPGGSYANSTDITSLSFGAQACDINGAPGTPYRYFNGKIDDIRIYNRVLTSSEIESLYNEENPILNSVNDASPSDSSVSFYPNPTKEQIIFSQAVNVQLTNITGQVLVFIKNTTMIDVSQQPSGVYFLTITDKNGQVIQRNKLVKE